MDATKAIERYTAKLDPTYIGAVFATKKDGMVSDYGNSANDSENIEGLLRGTISGVTPAPAPLTSARYQAAGKEMMRARAKWYGGTVFDIRMAEIIARWTARGLTGAILLQIGYEVFGWTPPS
jgi:hypothetical protein